MNWRASPWVKYWREALLCLTSILVGYCLLEIGYRIYQYQTLPDRLFAEVARNGPNVGGLYVYDPHTGYRYPPNFEEKRGHPWFSRWRTNSHGHVSRFEYPKEKPANEYRIAVIGDSYTASINNNVRWTELLEDHLNAAPEWNEAVERRVTRVINFGVDGFGFMHFAAMLRHQTLAFQPDLVIVNFIGDDILRRFRFVVRPDGTGDQDQRIRTFVKTDLLDRIDWLRLRPELFAATIGSHFGMRSELPLDHRMLFATTPSFRFASRKQAIAASAAAVTSMVQDFPAVLFLQCPEYWELSGDENILMGGLVDELRAAAPAFSLITMKSRLDTRLDGMRFADRPDLVGKTWAQLMALPFEQKLELHRWFFLPDDLHLTDYASEIYAREVAEVLIERAREAGLHAN